MKKLTLRIVALVAVLSLLIGCAASFDSENVVQSPLGNADESTSTETVPEPTTASADAATQAVAYSDENAEPHAGAESYGYEATNVAYISLGTAISTTSDAVSIAGTTATITAAGVYELAGTLADGQIIVDAGDDVVQLILNGANITNSNGAAIAVMSAETAIVILADGSSNTLSDGDTYVLAEGEDEPNATLFSKADLTVTGGGALTVVGNYNDGIASKDGLVIENGTIAITAVDDAIRGKDYVVIDGGQIQVTAGGDGIKSDDDEDPERGYIAISEGTIDLDTGDDGLQAATDVLITGGTLDINAGSTGTSDSARGIQGDVSVTISGGTVSAIATDDAIHSNSTVTVDGGALTLTAGDDGIHGDLFVTINDGSILITDSYEGIESEVITINDGFIDLTSNDDGLNVATAETTTTQETTQAAPAGGRGGQGGGGEAVGDNYIYINGGTISITVTGALAEQGDGIDANGHVEMTGGVVTVSGPTDTRNSAVDYSGGSFVMSGGTLIGTNVNGRNSEGVGAGSPQASLYLTLGSVVDGGTLIHIQTSDGEGLVTFEPTNNFDVIVFSSPDLVAGETYEIYVGGTAEGESSSGLYATYTAGTLAGTATVA